MYRILILIGILMFSCNTEKKNQKQKIPSYEKDSSSLVGLIHDRINKKENPYFQEFYDDETEVLIDTILYNTNSDKLVFFVINKVKNKKRYPGNISEEQAKDVEKLGNLPYEGFHYNGHAFIAKRTGNNDFLIKDFSVINLEKYKNIKSLKKKLKKIFFQDYSDVNEKGYEYNLNDNRFWDNDNVWQDF